MENAADALKMAFGIMIFVVALSITISCFSQAREAIESIATMKDREITYLDIDYENTEGLTRTVGVETIIPTMYKAYQENFIIYFWENSNKTIPYELYKKTVMVDNIPTEVTINYIDLEQEVWPNKKTAIEHLNKILDEGLYDKLSNAKFTEILGEYYQEDKEAGYETDVLEVNKTKKRVITYILNNN